MTISSGFPTAAGRKVDPEDDRLHAIGAEPEYSESLYYQFGDVETKIAGFLRMADRPNEGRGERTVCLWLPDGKIAFSFAPVGFDEAGEIASQGMRVTVDEPLVRHTVGFEGEVSVLADGWEMSEPRAALARSPKVECSVELEVSATAPAQAFHLDDTGDFTANHFDQFAASRGTVRVGGLEASIQAHGMRDRSWGPRSWQAPSFYRWLFGSCDGFGFAAGILGRDGSHRTGGFVSDGGEMYALDRVEVETGYDGTRVRGARLRLIAGEREWEIAGRALNSLPLRNRRRDSGSATRILETSMYWRVGGHEMIGIAEYLDQLDEGRPVGMAAYDGVPR